MRRVVAYESEDISVIPVARMFKAMVLESDQLFPKLLPDAIRSIEITEGDGGAGSIKKLSFAYGGRLSYVKEITEELDIANMKVRYSVIEGDALEDNIEKISYEIKWTPSSTGGSICKIIRKYYTKPGFDNTEELFKAGKSKAAAVIKAVEAYLLANPDVLN